jgi:membrane protease YdiL (CAAX protease family)
MPGWYEIRIKEEIGEKWLAWFDEFTVTRTESGETLLTGPIADQSALHGLLAKIRDLNLTLLTVNLIQPESSPEMGRSKVTAWIRRHDVLLFFLMVFVLGWPRAIVEAGYSQGWLARGPSSFLTILYLLGTPLVSALIVIAVTHGRVGLKEWSARLIHWRVNWRWYLFVLFGYPLMTALAYTVSDLIAGRDWSVLTVWKVGFENLRVGAADLGINPQNNLQILGILLLASFLVPIFEEGGWRAFAIPRLQQKYSVLTSALVMGVIWSVWHLPNFYTIGADHYGMPFLWFLLTITSTSILMVWIMNNTNQSVLMTILFHGSIILWGHFLPAQLEFQNGDHVAFWLTCAFSVITSLIIIFKKGPQLK